MVKPPHILNAASNLLGIALLIITGLHVSRYSATTFADEIAWGAAVSLMLSCLFSYLASRAEPLPSRYEALDAEVAANQAALEAAGHWGVPTLVFEGEPFFGQDRIDLALWRMQQADLRER